MASLLIHAHAQFLFSEDAALTVKGPIFHESLAQFEKAQDLFFAPTPISWPAKIWKLSDLLWLLAASGNATSLSIESNANETLSLPAFSGTYWQAVCAMCTAYDLDIEDGECLSKPDKADRVYQEIQAHSPTAIESQGGPVILNKHGSATRAYSPNGPILGLIRSFANAPSMSKKDEGDVNLDYVVRFEPHLRTNALYRNQVLWERIEDENGNDILAHQNSPALPDASAANQPHQMPFNTPRTLKFQGTVIATREEPIEMEATLTMGSLASQSILGRPFGIGLRRTVDEGPKPDGTPQAYLCLSLPRSIFSQSHQITVRDGGTKKSLRPFILSDQKLGHIYTMAVPSQDSVHVTFTGTMILPERRIPIFSTIAMADLPVLTAPSTRVCALLSPTMLTWPAGKMSLAMAIAILRSHGNDVGIQGDIDQATTVDMPSFHGSFWQAILDISDSYRLCIDEPILFSRSERKTGSHGVAGGPVVLRPLENAAHGRVTRQACGIALASIGEEMIHAIQTLKGSMREVAFSYAIRMEPHFDLSSVQAASTELSSLATDDPTLHVMNLEHLHSSRQEEAAFRSHAGFPARGHPTGQAADTLILDDLPYLAKIANVAARANSLPISGMLTLRLGERVHGEVDLYLGQQRVMLIGAASLGISFMPPLKEMEVYPELCINNYPSSFQVIDVSVTEPDGTLSQMRFPYNQMQFRNLLVWRYQSSSIPGARTVAISATRDVQTVKLPFSLHIPIP